MVLKIKRLSLWGHDVVIRVRAQTPHHVFDVLDQEACFYYCMDGTSALFTPLQNVYINERQGISLQCGNYIGKFFSNSEVQEAEILIIKFTKDILKKIYLDDLPFLFQKIKKKKRKQIKVVSNSILLEDYVKGLLFYLDHPHLAIEELLALKIRELFILLANSNEYHTVQQLIESLFSEVDFNFRKTIEKNYFTDLKVDQLAHLCTMSLSTFKRRFKEEFGTTPHQFFLQRKLEKAKGLIKSTSLTMSEIANQCGFHEYSNFSAAFKKKYAVSPRDFREL